MGFLKDENSNDYTKIFILILTLCAIAVVLALHILNNINN